MVYPLYATAANSRQRIHSLEIQVGDQQRTINELKAAIADSRKQNNAVLIDLKVLPKTMTDGYNSWWNVGIEIPSVLEGRAKARLY